MDPWTQGLGSELAQKKQQGLPILVTYVTAGFPDASTTTAWIDLLLEAGVDAVELGYPYENPRYDGAVIAEANRQACRAGFTNSDYVDIAQTIHARHPGKLLAMGYWEQLREGFAERGWQEAGLRTLLFPDIQETADTRGLIRQGYNLVPFFGSKEQDLTMYENPPFVYCPGYLGKTGEIDGLDRDHMESCLGVIQQSCLRRTPVLVGFGVNSGADAAEVRSIGFDGVVVGSAIVKALAQNPLEAKRLVQELRSGLGGA